ncbi:MAG: helix-turn-helix domain-containing protein [Candidatus Aminicenantes bacterium]|nr:helix-turn-helix domain-containing protein [Candidatus Aminicenantes bacterium]
MSKWIKIEEAANYIGIGETVLDSMAKEGKIPANKVENKWLFNTESLDAWIKAKKPIEAFFLTTDFNIEENPQLREPQINAYKSIYDYFKASNNYSAHLN